MGAMLLLGVPKQTLCNQHLDLNRTLLCSLGRVSDILIPELPGACFTMIIRYYSKNARICRFWSKIDNSDQGRQTMQHE